MDTSGQITFGKNPIFGALSVVLPDLASDFRGDLLSLTVLDSLASRFKVPFSLSTVWEKLLNASEIARYVIACGNGHGIDKMEMSLASALQREAQVSLDRQRDMKTRSRLLAVLQDMDKQLNVGWIRPESERNVFKTVIRLALETAAKGPAAHFRIDLCRQGIIKLKTGDVHANKTEVGHEG